MAAVIALGAAGCGDEASSSASAEPITIESGSLSKQEFIAQADAICEEASTEMQEAGEEYGRERGGAKSPQETKALLEKQLTQFVNEDVGPALEGATDEISSLGAPAGDTKEITAVFRELQKGLEESKKDPQKFFLGNKAFFEAAELGSEYGFKRCGRLVSQ